MNNRNVKSKNRKPGIFIGAGIIVIIVVTIFTIKGTSTDNNTAAISEDLKILKSEISSTAKFFPVKVGETNMEVLAVKANDGTIRTAFNTCQVCYSSGKGYYKQQGNELICQNCGNRFKMEQVEKIKGGCNPVPILKENKTEDGTNIIISKDFLAKYKELFANWKRSS